MAPKGINRAPVSLRIILTVVSLPAEAMRSPDGLYVQQRMRPSWIWKLSRNSPCSRSHSLIAPSWDADARVFEFWREGAIAFIPAGTMNLELPLAAPASHTVSAPFPAAEATCLPSGDQAQPSIRTVRSPNAWSRPPSSTFQIRMDPSIEADKSLVPSGENTQARARCRCPGAPGGRLGKGSPTG